MLKSSNPFESWPTHPTSEQQKNKLAQLHGRVEAVKKKWMDALEESISLWVNYILLRVRGMRIQVGLEGKGCEGDEKEGVQRMYGELEGFVSECEISVLKGIKNVEKLYMIPQLKTRSQSKQSKQKDKSRSVFSKIKQKSRSSSFSSARSRNHSIFSTIKPTSTISAAYKKPPALTSAPAPSSQPTTKHNTTVLKQYKPRPKFQPSFAPPPALHSALLSQVSQLPQDSVEGFGRGLVSREMTESLEIFMAGREDKERDRERDREREEGILEKVQSKFEERLRDIQAGLNEKLGYIMENLAKNRQDERTSTKQANQPKPTQQNKQAQKQNQPQELTLKQKTKRNSLIKRITANPITEEQASLQTVSFTPRPSPTSIPTPFPLPMPSKPVQSLQTIQKNLQQFISLTKKVKLPISQALVRIFVNAYTGVCRDRGAVADLGRFGIGKWEGQGRGLDKEARGELKESIVKLRKLLSMDGLNGKAQKIRLYLEQCLRCCYTLILNQDPQLKQQTSIQNDNVINQL